MDPRIQSGTLTAGSFDDNERFDDFRHFLAEAARQDRGRTVPPLAVDGRVIIQVTDEPGKPMGDARVIVHALHPQRRAQERPSDGKPLLDSMTGSDGRTLFLTELDGGRTEQEFAVTVHTPDESAQVSQVMRLDQRPWQITLPSVRSRAPIQLDLALVIDATGSMSDELEYLKTEIDCIAAAVYEMFPDVDQRYALVVYRDEGDEYVTRTVDFTGSIDGFRATLAQQRAQGGGDYPEAVHLALEQAGNLSWRDRDTARVLFLVGDAPPHDQFTQRTLSAVGVFRQQGVRVFPVAASGVDPKAEFVMRAAAFLTLGQYLFLTDHSGVGNSHAKPHVPEYQVERLDRLMIRMIASELAGRRLLPHEIIATDGEQAPAARPAPIPQPNAAAANTRRSPPPATRAESGILSQVPRWLILVAVVLSLCLVNCRSKDANEQSSVDGPA